jgi:hypothetical protein
MSGRNRRALAPIGLLMAAALTMLAAPEYAFLGENGIDVSPAVWNIAVAFCRVITGVLGLLAIVSAVTGRRSASSRRDTFGSIAGGVVLIAAAIAGLELVLVITGVVGFGLLCVGGAAAVGPTLAYDSSGRSTTQPSGAATKREPRPYGPARIRRQP